MRKRARDRRGKPPEAALGMKRAGEPRELVADSPILTVSSVRPKNKMTFIINLIFF